MSDEYKLASAIIPLSDAARWDEAKLEWELAEIYRRKEPDTCLCGHYPINELCILRNKKNNNNAIVGNVCVNKFLGLNSKKLFDAIKRIQKDIERALNAEVIDHAHKCGWFNAWDRNFYLNTWRKRNLTGKQLGIRTKLNRRVLARVHSVPVDSNR